MAVVAGRREATTQDFQSMFVAHYAMVVRTVRLIVHDNAVAEEVTQDAFVQLLRNWRKVSTYERPDLWVRRVAIRQGQRQVAPGPATKPARAGELARRRDHRLPSGRRGARCRPRAATGAAGGGRLFYLEDRPMDEIADILGCSVSTGWSQLHNARKRLAAALCEEVDPDVR